MRRTVLLIFTLLLSACAASWLKPAIAHSFRSARVPPVMSADAEEARIRESLETSKKDLSTASLRHQDTLSVEEAKQASFERAQVLGQELATLLSESCSAGEPMPEEAVEVLRALISSTAGARGWFVTLLTNPAFDAVFQPPIDEALLGAISETVRARFATDAVERPDAVLS